MSGKLKAVSCLIAAAGLGTRFRKSKKGTAPKLDLPLGSGSLLDKTLEPFLQSRMIKEIVIAAPSGRVPAVRKKIAGIKSKKIKIVKGGKTRTDSVYRALKSADSKIPWVIVHDGARPLLDRGTLEKYLRRLFKAGALVLGRPVVPTLKSAKKNKIQNTVCRKSLWEAETPQGFRKDILQKAYRNYFKRPFSATDEASLVEASGEKVFLFKNEKLNLKITTFTDYCIAKSLSEGEKRVQTGIGYDIHRLVEGRPLWLGGLRISFPKGALGHSDGDPVLHALSDALLGAAALGDIGEYFPDTSKKIKGIASSKILKTVYDLVKSKGYELINADINVIIERPKLGKLKNKIRNRIARILCVSDDRISLKARTAEGLGAVGKGDAVASQAIVTLQKEAL